jgi:hypothetical protein
MLSLASAAVHADDLIGADRPDLADGTSTVGHRTFQVEAGLYRDHDDRDQRSLATPLQVRFGIGNAFELRLETDGYRHFSDFAEQFSGWSNFSAGFKWRLATEGTVRPALAVIVDASPASGSSVFRTVRTTGDLTLAADKSLGDHWSVTPNVGVVWLDGGDLYGRYTAFITALTVEYAFRPSLAVFVDGALQAPEVPDESPVHLFGLGAAWIVGRDTQLDVALGWGGGGASVPAWFWTAGVSRRF